MVDLPTDGKPMSATRASPTFSTSNPTASADPPFGGASSAVRSLARRARRLHRWDMVALLIWVRPISFSMSLIFSTIDMANATDARSNEQRRGWEPKAKETQRNAQCLS